MLYKVRNIELVVGRCLCNRDNALSHTAPLVGWLGVRLVARCCIFGSFSMIVNCALWHMPISITGHALQPIWVLYINIYISIYLYIYIYIYRYIIKTRPLARTEHLILCLGTVKCRETINPLRCCASLEPSVCLRNVLGEFLFAMYATGYVVPLLP